MKTTIQMQDGQQVVLFEGRLDTAAAPKTEQDLQPLYACSEDIILDCTNLEYISSSGLRLFLGLLKAVKPKGNHLYISGMNDDLKQVFSMTGFTSLFEFK